MLTPETVVEGMVQSDVQIAGNQSPEVEMVLSEVGEIVDGVSGQGDWMVGCVHGVGLSGWVWVGLDNRGFPGYWLVEQKKAPLVSQQGVMG